MTQDNVSSVLAKAESLALNGEFGAAAAVLRSLEADSLTGRERALYELLTGETMVQLGSLDHDHIDCAIEHLRKSADNELYARAKLIKGWQLQLLGQNQEAAETLLEAYAAFLKVGAHDQAAHTLNRLARLQFIRGEVERAIENLRKCIQHFAEVRNEGKACSARMNLGLALWRCGRLTESRETYAAIEASDLKPQHRLVMHVGLCAVIAQSGDLKTALSRIVALEAETQGFAREQITACEYSGWIHLLAGKHKQAEVALSKGLRLALETAPESALVSQIKRLFGDLYVATGKYDLAEQYALEALTVAEKLTERLEIAACCRVFAQVEQARGHGDKARQSYAQAIDLFSQIGARYELATTRLLAGSSDLYPTGERMAMLFLARENFESEKLTHLIEQVDTHLTRPVARPVAPTSSTAEAPVIVGKSKALTRVLDMVSYVADCETTILLTGETGTGKDLLARYIHFVSGRSGEFVAVNAAAVPVTMIESELFGHTRGSYTGATADRKGLFEQAEDGTFYLNEVADAGPEFQAKLLDVLETRTVRRLGSNKSRAVNFRLIAATNRDLEQMVREDHFRSDLYHRLRQVPITLPSLDERRDDIPLLAQHFLKITGAAPDKMRPAAIRQFCDLLMQRDWPGNVRELRATILRLLAMGRGDIEAMIRLLAETTQESERDRLLRVLESTDWNRSQAAEALGVSEGTIRNRIKKYGLTESVGSSQSYK